MSHRKKVTGDEEFSTLDVCKILNLKRERLRDWMNRGFIEPGTYLEQPKTAADIAVFHREELFRTYLFKVLLEVGYTRKYAAESVKRVMSLDILTEDTLILRVTWPKPRGTMIRTLLYWKPIRDMLYKQMRAHLSARRSV